MWRGGGGRCQKTKQQQQQQHYPLVFVYVFVCLFVYSVVTGAGSAHLLKSVPIRRGYSWGVWGVGGATTRCFLFYFVCLQCRHRSGECSFVDEYANP